MISIFRFHFNDYCVNLKPRLNFKSFYFVLLCITKFLIQNFASHLYASFIKLPEKSEHNEKLSQRLLDKSLSKMQNEYQTSKKF